MAEQSSIPSSFQGFDTPYQNWFRMPNEWVDLCAEINSLAELKVVQYVMRHTWGHQEYGVHKLISLDEFMYGRRRKDGSRIDSGTGLTKKSVIAGIKSAVERGFLIEEIDDSDKARIRKYYVLRMAQQNDSDGYPSRLSNQENTLSRGREKKVNADVYFLHPGVEKVHTGCEESIHRTEKDTLERHQQKEHVEQAVVDALSTRGISSGVAEHIALKHPRKFIEEKIAFHDFLLAKRPHDIKKPAAWLRKAIEDDYKAPDGFASVEDQQRQEAEVKRRKQAVLAAQEAYQKAGEEAVRSEQERLLLRLSSLRERYNTTKEALKFWGKVKDRLEHTVTAPVFALMADSHILQLDRKSATVAVTAEFKLRQIEQPKTRSQIQQAVQEIAGTPIEVTFTLLTE